MSDRNPEERYPKPNRIPLVLMRPEDGESEEDFAERFFQAMNDALAGQEGQRDEVAAESNAED